MTFWIRIQATDKCVSILLTYKAITIKSLSFFLFCLHDSEFHSKYFHTIHENREPELSFPMRLCQVDASSAEAEWKHYIIQKKFRCTFDFSQKAFHMKSTSYKKPVLCFSREHSRKQLSCCHFITSLTHLSFLSCALDPQALGGMGRALRIELWWFCQKYTHEIPTCTEIIKKARICFELRQDIKAAAVD